MVVRVPQKADSPEGYIGAAARSELMAENADKTKEVATPKEVQVAPEAQRGGVISENLNQAG